MDLLATLAPTLREAVDAAQVRAFVILDGTLLPIDRIATDRPYHAGKRKRHGMNVRVNRTGFALGSDVPRDPWRDRARLAISTRA